MYFRPNFFIGMQSQLIVKNFGPIDSVDLNLRNVNIFIGPQASGKSALAKIYTVFKAPRKFLKNIHLTDFEETNVEIYFKNVLEEYNIVSFLRPDSKIEFDSELHYINYENGKINYVPKLLKRIQRLQDLSQKFDDNRELVKKEIIELTNNFLLFDFRATTALQDGKMDYINIQEIKRFNELNTESFQTIIKIIEEIENELSTNAALYIPSERNFINVIKNSSLNLLLNNVPIPKHILSFGAEVEKASMKEIDLGFLHENLIYRSIDGEDRIFSKNDYSIKLTEAASGIQSALPILLPILSHKRFAGHRSFVIEEPELNLFPIAQYELIKKLEHNRHEPYWEDIGSIHTYTTHSPYILSAINNLLYANKVKAFISSNSEDNEIKLNAENKVKEIVPADINPYYFTAYQINKGRAESIFDRDSGLINDNYIDKSSDKLGDDFEALMEIMEDFKHIKL